MEYGTLSYKVWASQRDVEVPLRSELNHDMLFESRPNLLLRFYGDQGVFPGDKATPIYLLQWLSDTPVYLDAIEIVAEKARRFWWGQQLDLGLVSWSLLLAIEGRRRNIPLLWCYQLLGQLVSLSFAENLFFVALLLTPSPLPLHDASLPVSRFVVFLARNRVVLTVDRYVALRNRIFPPKPNNWKPHPFLFFIVSALNFAAISQLPFLANTPSLKYVIVASRILSFLPLILTYVVPTSWGLIQVHHHDAYGSYKQLFRFISAISFILQTKALLVGLAYNALDAHSHRHSGHFFFDVEQRSAWERTTSAFGRILGATSDHPVVWGVGWDVLLSVISIGCWAAVRAMDVSDILASAVPVIKGDKRPKEEVDVTTGETKALVGSSNGTSPDQPAGPRRRGRPRKVKPEPREPEPDETYEPTPSEVAETEVGDELPDAGLEWESAAVVWGLTALGGLGVGSAGAFGGECVAR